MDLIQHYKVILESLGMKVEDSGLVSTKVGDDWTPTTVNGKRLVLPTREVLSNPDWDTTIAFHPLSEKIQRGESTILKALCVFVNVRLTSVIAALMEDLMALAVDTDRHSSLKPAQLKALRGAPEAKEATLNRLIKILERVSYKGDTRIFNLYLKRGGELNERKCVRVATVSFPIANYMFEDGEPKVFKELFGVTGLTITDSKSIFGILNYIIPDFEKPNVYSAGTQDTEAPYFHALMLAYNKVAMQLNKVTTLMANAIRDPEDLLIDLSWMGLLDDLHSYKAKIPVLEGNEGELSEDTLTAKRAGSGIAANAANMRVNSGVAGGDSERVSYRSPINDEEQLRPKVIANGSHDRLEHAEEAPAEDKPKLSSWAKRSATLHGGNRPAIVARAGQSEGKVLLGKDSEGYPVYGEAPAPIRQQRRQEPIIETIFDDYGNPLYNGYYDQTGNFIIVDQQQMAPPPQQRRGQPAPYHQPQPFRGHPPQRQQPMNSRQAMNSRRAPVGFANTRNNQW
jgi:hypothetical protein